MRLYLPIGFLVFSSLVVLSSISSQVFLFQSIWVLFSAIIFFIFFFIDWRSIFNYRWMIFGIYVFSLALLVVTHFKGILVNNTRSWLSLGSFTFQPVELVKVSLILIFAGFFSRRHVSVARWKNIFTSFIYFAIPAALVAVQPDFGSLLILFGIWFGFLLVSGLPLKRILLAILIFSVVGIFMWTSVLKNYQRDRIVAVFYPEKNLLGINYSVNQAKIAIGSAGFFGKGYGQGSQTQLGFLTTPDTDFIFAALVEEWGWLVGVLILSAFIYIIFRILKIASLADQNFEKFICVGVAVTLSWQFFLNIGSVLGISPVIGVTFPFLSHGGSSLLTSSFLIAIINSIAKKS